MNTTAASVMMRDNRVTAVSAQSGATAGRFQGEPLTDLEQLEGAEEEDTDAGTAG